MTRALLLTCGAAALLGLAACGGGDGGAPGGAASPTAGASYTIRGRYLGPVYDGEAASIAHEAVPGFMDAMTMPFRLEDPALLEGLAPETPIRFTLEDRGEGFRLTALEPLPPDTPLDLAP